jgi:type I restriction enzyme, R subunit
MKLRQFGELLAQQVAAYAGVYDARAENQSDLLGRLKYKGVLTPRAADLFHMLRKVGNVATHDGGAGTHSDALQAMKIAREAAIWMHRSYGRAASFNPGPFVPPRAPENPAEALAAELARLQGELEQAKTSAAEALAAAAEQRELLASAEARALKEAEDREFYAKYAEETERELSEKAAALAKLQTHAEHASQNERREQQQAAEEADTKIDLDEAATRRIVDDALRVRGWEADSELITYAAGVRPHRSRNLAIAEWPTASGPVDYALFCGTTCVGVVEAKRKSADVPSVLQQAKRYAEDITLHDGIAPPEGSPWGKYRVPFLFATNARPYLKQLATKSGIWFWDARLGEAARPLQDWYTPKGLLRKLEQDLTAANARLRTEPLSYLGLRDYQENAIRAVEAAIEQGRQTCLLAMATGTGKTCTAIGLIYRLVKSGRFRRVLFLVDRTALGDQAFESFGHMKLEQQKSFTEIYDVKALADLVPDEDTKLHFATIQSLLRRTLLESDEGPPVDQYDLIVVDECHRGYNLDRELSDTELSFRDELEYISKYRRVLEYFDAVKVGLTATPALHTTEIFGEPVFTYSYRDAVVDGWLVDHEPPYRVITHLAKHGIQFEAGEAQVFQPDTAQLDLIHLEDEVRIEVEGFNRQVITENFNQAACEYLAQQIDPTLDGKTLIFCVNRAHADIVVHKLKRAFEDVYGSISDDAVARITGDIDRPNSMIRRFKNEAEPKVAVTVDLLTTGIDVPKICNLVFLRRVRSRILYEQMLGRATRLCPEIGKEVFRVFDCVDLYRALEPVCSMKPVVTNPKVTFEQLVGELHTVQTDAARRVVLDQLLSKLRVKIAKMKPDARAELSTLTDRPVESLAEHFANSAPTEVAHWFQEHPTIAGRLDRSGSGRSPILVSHHEDSVIDVERGYGDGKKPEDYLNGFKRFLETHMNEIPALLVVTQRPRDLTREQLIEIKRALDKEGYSEVALRTAYRQVSNRDVAASIIGYIRQQTLGEALISYEERVDRAVRRILERQDWSPVQRQWLTRIGLQLKAETVVDRAALDGGQFKENGGFARLNRVFDKQLEQILGDINDALWNEPRQTG